MLAIASASCAAPSRDLFRVRACGSSTAVSLPGDSRSIESSDGARFALRISVAHRQRSIVPALGASGFVYINAKAMRLEHNTAVLTAARARKPPENRSWCRMGHLRPECGPNSRACSNRRPGSERVQLQVNPEGSWLKRTKADLVVGCPAFATSGPRTDPFKRMSEEDAGANQAHHRCHCFDHREHTLVAPRVKETTCSPAQSK